MRSKDKILPPLGLAMVKARGNKTQDQIALELNMNQGTFSRIETGERVPSAKSAWILAKWLKLPMEQILDMAMEGKKFIQNLKSPPIPEAREEDRETA